MAGPPFSKLCYGFTGGGAWTINNYLAHRPADAWFVYSIYDGIYLLSITLIILSRFIDIRYLKGETVYGTPASAAHLRWHILVMVPIYLLFLILAHVLGILL